MKLKILFFSSNPYSDLKLDKEYNELLQSINSSQYRSDIELKYISATKIDDFINHLNKEEPHILHFSGHGTEDGELTLHDKTDKYDELLSKESFQKLIQTTNSNIKLIFLNACYSKVTAEQLKSDVDYVISMNSEIKNNTAIAFAIQFYNSFFADKTIDESFNQAIVRLETEYKEEVDIPELLGKKDTRFYLSEIITKKNNAKKKITIFFSLTLVFLISSIWYLFDNRGEKKEKPIEYKQLKGKIIDMVGNPIEGIKVILPNGESNESNGSGEYIFYNIITNKENIYVNFEYDEHQYENPDEDNNNNQKFGLEYNPVQFRRLD